MKLFGNFLKWHRKIILAFLLFSVVFAIVFSLYNLPLSAVMYAVAICAFLGLIIMLLDFFIFLRKHRALQGLMNEIKITPEHLPVSNGQIEADYQRLIQVLHSNSLKLTDEMTRQYTDMTDYYTVWVHQIKTPISSMKLSLQGADFPGSRELYEDLQRIEQYVEMVLCYVRLDSDSTDYVIKEYDLDHIVKQAVRNLGYIIFSEWENGIWHEFFFGKV